VQDHRLSPRQGTQRWEEPQWPCLLPSIAVAVAPLRSLTGDPAQRPLVEGLTDRLLTDLFRRCRGFSFAWIAGERHWTANLAPPSSPELKYVVSGSIQRGSPQGMLRVNVRISDAVTADYLWAGRQEFRAEDAASIQTDITPQISRVLHNLLLHEASRRASVELGVNECLAQAMAALQGELCAGLSAKAQKWFLAALACDPRNVEALVGLALTCQHLVSNPWWCSDTRAVAAASDLGGEAVTIALELQPEHALARCVQGMLYSAAGELKQAEAAFDLALAMNRGLGSAHAFSGYNQALLGNAGETLPAIERAMRLDPTDRRHSIFFCFGGFAELLLGRTHEAVVLLQKSLERNPTYGSAQLFLMVALSLTGRHRSAALLAESFRQQYPESPANAFERLWLSRSASPMYRAQVFPLFEKIQTLGATS
jgi:TolB-like protein/Tfp pilus assembly protein PilF